MRRSFVPWRLAGAQQHGHDKSADDKDQLQWKWAAGVATTEAEFGDPVHADDYILCPYDETGLLGSRLDHGVRRSLMTADPRFEHRAHA